MKHFSRFLAITTLCLCWAWWSGCSPLAPVPDRSKYFVLTPISESDLAQSGSTAQSSASTLGLGLGPIRFPPYLDRSEIVTRAAPNRLQISQTDLWAEPLKTNFTRVLGQNLSSLLGTQQIVSFPWFSSVHIDYQVAIDVMRFENNAQGNAQLSAQWTIEDPTTRKVLYQGDSNLTEPAASPDETASAAALSRALADFSRQIASAVRQVHEHRMG